jgi:hypothetical protein
MKRQAVSSLDSETGWSTHDRAGQTERPAGSVH